MRMKYDVCGIESTVPSTELSGKERTDHGSGKKRALWFLSANEQAGHSDISSKVESEDLITTSY